MSLTPAEKAFALVFRAIQSDILDQKNAREEPAIVVSVLVRHYRHNCAEQGGKSVSLELREHYVLSPEQGILDSAVVAGKPGPGSGVTVIPAERFGFIFTEGRCPACGVIARSGTGRLVDPGTRPPSPRSVMVRPITRA